MNKKEQIINLYTTGTRCAEIARQLEVSRQYVQQILKYYEVPTPTEVPKRCLGCGVSLPEFTNKYYCTQECRAKYRLEKSKQGVCPICGKAILPRSRYCMQHKWHDLHSLKPLIIHAYEDGAGAYKLAEKYNVHYGTVYRWLKEVGVPVREPKKRGSRNLDNAVLAG